ncbi:hypothetical protein [Lysobacter sp. A3-1-A15]|uniref:hypothetical protein n=1 Tax=Novilysobacter viscosus TaxID=3098602 RepID=UPI002ED94B4A
MHRTDPGFDSSPVALDLHATLDAVLRHVLAVSLVVLALVPAARGHHEALGWLPMWLLGMPAVALWALRGCPLPVARGGVPARATGAAWTRRVGPQARRRGRRVSPVRPVRAA